MKIQLLSTLKKYKKEYLKQDIFSGIIIAAVSIPISMGYAQIAGLPPAYGLYGSILPILLFAIFSTSKQFIFGVDAAPAALAGSALLSLGIVPGSEAALNYIPILALFTGLWLLFFYIIKADRIVNFISTPVMGGFISGIALTIILMQIPKLMGSSAGSGEVIELAEHIYAAGQNIHWLSLGLGLGTLLIIRICKKWIPKFPVAILIMAAGVVCTAYFHVDAKGVALLDSVGTGLPPFFIPDFNQVDLTQAAGRGLMISLVVMAETLLAENNFAFRNGYNLNDRQEILACAAGNVASAFVGSCPVNGSISRTSMNEQYGGHSQVVSITAGITMTILLLFFTGFIGYLPIPILTAIVISALMDVVEVHLCVRLFRLSKQDFYIFMAACISVLFLGTIYGVLIGVLLSFFAIITKSANPSRSFLGVIPGKDGYYDLIRNAHAYPIKDVVLYQFNENLFFANIKVLQEDLEDAVSPDTKVVIIDARAINNIDITAADRLAELSSRLTELGIHFYITEHTEKLNQQMRQLGIEHLIREGHVRRTILAALHDADIYAPYELDIPDSEKERVKLNLTFLPAEDENTLEEFAWAYGDQVVEEMEHEVHHILNHIHGLKDIEEILENGLVDHLENWHSLGAFDEDELLRRIELHLDELSQTLAENQPLILQLIEKRRRILRDRVLREHPEVFDKLQKHRRKLEERLERQQANADSQKGDVTELQKEDAQKGDVTESHKEEVRKGDDSNLDTQDSDKLDAQNELQETADMTSTHTDSVSEENSQTLNSLETDSAESKSSDSDTETIQDSTASESSVSGTEAIQDSTASESSVSDAEAIQDSTASEPSVSGTETIQDSAELESSGPDTCAENNENCSQEQKVAVIPDSDIKIPDSEAEVQVLEQQKKLIEQQLQAYIEKTQNTKHKDREEAESLNK